MRVLAIFGPTAVGKTGVAIEVAELLRERGEDPVAVSCDSIQVYRGLEVLSGAASRERAGAARAPAARVRADRGGVLGRPLRRPRPRRDRRAARRGPAADRRRRHRPLPARGARRARAAPARPAGDPGRGRARARASAGPGALHAELAPELASGVHPNDRKRIVRLTELARLGIAPHASSEGLWTRAAAPPDPLVGLTIDRDELRPPDRRPGRGDGRGRRGGGGAQRGRRPAPRAPPAPRSASSELLARRRRGDEGAPSAGSRAASSPGCAGCRGDRSTAAGATTPSIAAEIVAALE